MSASRLRRLALAASCSLLAACGGDSITGPQRDARQMAARFEHVADSLYAAGETDAGDGAFALAEVLRTTDRLYTASVTVDGEARSYYALLMELRLPETQCFPGEVCEPAPEFVQIVVGWRGQSVTDGFAFLMDTTGTLAVTGATPESAPAAHVFGGLFERAGERAWIATSGSVVTARARTIDSCEMEQLGPAPSGFECRVGAVSFRANVALDELSDDGAPLAGSRRTLAIDGQNVAGLVLTISEMPDAMREGLSPRRLLPIFR